MRRTLRREIIRSKRDNKEEGGRGKMDAYSRNGGKKK